MTLIGHQTQRAAFEAAWQGRSFHHGWLLSGPRGVGKRAFADAAARMVLSGAEGFEAAEGSDGAAKFDAGAHPDFRKVARTENDHGNLRTQIVLDDIRPIADMLGQHPSLSEWRVVTVDSACEMNRNAANALLKNLEEPPKKTVFLLVCHSSGRLLPTIRSRCRALAFRPLPDSEVAEVLRRELGEEPGPALVEVARGAPGRAVRFAGLEVGKLLEALERLRGASGATASAIATGLAGELGRKPAAARYEAFLELVPAYLSDQAKDAPPDALEEVLSLWEEARDLAAAAPARALDPAAVSYQLARLVARVPNHRQAA